MEQKLKVDASTNTKISLSKIVENKNLQLWQHLELYSSE